MPHHHGSEAGQRSRQKLPSLTGVRFFAAALVFFFHASLAEVLGVFEDRGFADGYAQAFSKVGFVGVSSSSSSAGLCWPGRRGRRTHCWLSTGAVC